MALQESLHELRVGIDLYAQKQTRVLLLHSRDRQWHDVRTGTQYGADCDPAGETRFERADFRAREVETREPHAGMPQKDFAIAGRRHLARLALEQFYIEGAFDLLEQLAGARLRQTGSGGGACQRPQLIEMNDQG